MRKVPTLVIASALALGASAALIAQGGLGDPIIAGLAINDTGTILEGAIPAAILALAAGWLFDLLDLAIIPKGLRLKRESA